jgi:hypothetical protein
VDVYERAIAEERALRRRGDTRPPLRLILSRAPILAEQG